MYSGSRNCGSESLHFIYQQTRPEVSDPPITNLIQEVPIEEIAGIDSHNETINRIYMAYNKTFILNVKFEILGPKMSV